MDRCSVASTGIMRDAIQRRAAEPSVRGLATVSVACFGAMQYLQRRVASSSPPVGMSAPPWSPSFAAPTGLFAPGSDSGLNWLRF